MGIHAWYPSLALALSQTVPLANQAPALARAGAMSWRVGLLHIAQAMGSVSSPWLLIIKGLGKQSASQITGGGGGGDRRFWQLELRIHSDLSSPFEGLQWGVAATPWLQEEVFSHRQPAPLPLGDPEQSRQLENKQLHVWSAALTPHPQPQPQLSPACCESRRPRPRLPGHVPWTRPWG